MLGLAGETPFIRRAINYFMFFAEAVQTQALAFAEGHAFRLRLVAKFVTLVKRVRLVAKGARGF